MSSQSRDDVVRAEGWYLWAWREELAGAPGRPAGSAQAIPGQPWVWRTWLVGLGGKESCGFPFSKMKKKKEKDVTMYQTTNSLNSLLLTSPGQGFPICFSFFYVKCSWGFARRQAECPFGAVWKKCIFISLGKLLPRGNPLFSKEKV